MKTLKELREGMQALKSEMQNLAQSGGEEWSSKFEAKKAEFATLKQQYDALAAIEDIAIPDEPAVKKLPTPATTDGKPQDPNKGVGIDNLKERFLYEAVKAIRDRDANRLQKDLMLTSTPLGGWMVPEAVANMILPMLKPATVFGSLGVRRIPLVDDKLIIPRLNSRASVYWQGEGGTIANTQFTGTRMTLDAKYATAIVPVSNRLLNSSQAMLVEEYIRQELISELSLAFEEAYLFGVGALPTGTGHTGAQPLGLYNRSINEFKVGADPDGSTNYATNGGKPTLVDFSRAMNMVERSNVRGRGTRAWVAHEAMRGQLRELVDDEGRHYFWQDSSSAGSVDRLGGYPIVFTNQIPITYTVGGSSDCTVMFFGEWSEFMIGDAATLEFASTSLSDSSFTTNETHIRAIAPTDCQTTYDTAFVKLTGITTGL